MMMNSELERTGKEAVVAECEVIFRHLSEVTREDHDTSSPSCTVSVE